MLSKTEPSDFKKEIDVVACYIQHDGTFLLLQRQPHKSNGNQWGLPAGKIDPGERREEAMQREIREETSLEISIEDLHYNHSFFVRNAGHDIHYHEFYATTDTLPKVLLSPNEHQQFAWVTPKEALDLPLVHDLDTCITMFYAK